MAAKKQIDANKVGWANNYAQLFKDFEHFKEYYDPLYKGVKAEVIWRKCGGKIEPKKDKEAAD